MAHACLYKYGASKYLSGLACMQADSNLEKITASCFQVLNAQNTNKNMPKKNSQDGNENLAWGKQELLIYSYVFWYTTKGEKAGKTSFYILFM